MADKDEAKRSRSSKAGTVTRRINELHGAIWCAAQPNELKEKIQKVKDVMELLGAAHDSYVSYIDATDEAELTAAEKWYYEYDQVWW